MSDTIKYCCLCGKSEEEAGSLMPVTGGLHVCRSCLENAMKVADQLSSFTRNSDNIETFMANFNPAGKEGMGKGTAPEKNAGDVKPQGNETLRVSEEGPVLKENDDAPSKEGEGGGSDEDDKDRQKGGSVRFAGGFGLPNIGFLNMADLQNMMFGTPAVKKKDKGDGEKKTVIDIKNVPLPHKIKALLDEYVIGQENAKKVMAVAVYNHYKRVASETMKPEDFEERLRDVEIEKSNVLLIGPTGCGKTYLVKTLAKLLDVPLAIADATSLTEAGYIGDDIESVVSKLLSAAGNDVERAETGIIFIDEIDKIAKKKNSHSRDVSGESVQQGMLKLLEGAEVEVPVGANSKNAMVPLATVDTRNILFICGGAFPDLDEIIKQRLRKQTSIGFNAELKDSLDKRKDILSEVTVEDIKKFGMIPEFVGRLPIICTMQGLTDEMMVDILKEPKNALIRQYQKLLSMDEVDLEFTDDALLAIARKAQKKETGARALRAIIEDIMLDIMYEIPKDDNIGRVTITADYLEGNGAPLIEMRA